MSDDIRIIDILSDGSIITCSIKHQINDIKQLGKILKGETNNSNGKIKVETGTLNSISFLFARIFELGIKAKTIIIGKIKLRKDSYNCLSFYGIKDNFKFTYEV